MSSIRGANVQTTNPGASKVCWTGGGWWIRAGDRLEIVGVERVGIDHPVPADDVERMARQRVAGQPAAVLDQDGRLLLEIDGGDLARAVEVALAVRSAQPQLAVGVEISAGDRDVAGRLDHEQVGLAGGLEFEPIGRAPRDDDVIEVAKRQRAEHACAACRGRNGRRSPRRRRRCGRAPRCGCSGRQRASVTSSLPKSATRPVIGSPERGIVRVFT